MKDFFISYNKADLSWAEWIAWQLEENGYTTVIQAWDFRPSSNFVLDMQKAAVEATRTIAVLSPDYLTSLYTQPEWAAAFVQDPTGEKGTLLPVRVRECEIKGLLSPIVYIDLVNLQEDSAKESLLKGVIIGRAKPAQPPAFPGKTPRTIAKKPRFPGSMPNIWNIQHGRNPNFTGREEILSALRQSLDAGQATALTQGQAIHGLGGVGKTQLAIEYAYRHCGEYEIVWWMRSEEPATLAGDYASLAMKLDLPEKEAQKQRVIIAAVKEWLRLNNGWLLIFDNATDSESVREYIPQGNAGRILVTSRNSNWRGLIKPLAVQKMEPDEAKTFLLNRTGQTDETNASELARELGYLPLALEQAGAFIDATGSTLSHYLKLFQTRQQEMLQRGKPSTEYPDTVATTWGMSFQQVEQKSQAAADLMKLCAFFAPDDISLEMLSNGAEYLPEPLAATVADTLALDEAIEVLRTYSLVERKDESLSIHRLVQAVTRHRMSEEEFKNWAEAAISVVNDSFPNDSDDVRTWGIILRLLPHSISVLEFAETINSVAQNTTRLLNQLGVYFYGRADYAQAKSFLERALAIDAETFGKNHPNVARDVNNLGLVFQALSDLQGAKALYERALAIDEKTFGKSDPNIARDVNNIGQVLKILDDLPGAKHYLERALAIGEGAFGKSHPLVAIYASNLGLVLQALGEFQSAKAYFERALAIDEKARGKNHPKVAIRLNNLGLALKALGDLQGAKALYERALAISQEAFGKNHPDIAIYAINIGEVLRDLGDLQGAKAHFERALTIDEEVFGKNHPDIARDIGKLGSVLKALGDLQGAKALYERGLTIDEKAFGKNHPQVAMFANNLGVLLHDFGNLQGARAYYERALAIDEETFGKNHPNVARDVNNIGLMLRDLGDLEGAKTYFERALGIFQKYLGDEHLLTKTVRRNLESLDE